MQREYHGLVSAKQSIKFVIFILSFKEFCIQSREERFLEEAFFSEIKKNVLNVYKIIFLHHRQGSFSWSEFRKRSAYGASKCTNI